jgi:tripartite-type tricarboxylate transporter receptor subunit TctC
MKSTAAPSHLARVLGPRPIGLARAPVLALICGVVATSSVAAQSYPTKPIKLLLPFGVGSPPDALGRLIEQCLSSRFHQGVVVENRPGAGSTIATKAAATAAPDGYTLLQVNSALAYAHELYPSPDYDPITSFSPS